VTSSIRTRDILFQTGMRAALSTSMAAYVSCRSAASPRVVSTYDYPPRAAGTARCGIARATATFAACRRDGSRDQAGRHPVLAAVVVWSGNQERRSRRLAGMSFTGATMTVRTGTSPRPTQRLRIKFHGLKRECAYLLLREPTQCCGRYSRSSEPVGANGDEWRVHLRGM